VVAARTQLQQRLTEYAVSVSARHTDTQIKRGVQGQESIGASMVCAQRVLKSTVSLSLSLTRARVCVGVCVRVHTLV
jgi:hypothetical protein